MDQDSRDRPDHLRCSYCNTISHTKDGCRILRPELAAPGWLPPGVLQHATYLENQAKVSGSGRGSGSSSAGGRPPNGSPRGSEAGRALGSQVRQANLPTITNQDSDFEEEDYALSKRRGTALVTHHHCFMTLLQQPQLVEAIEMQADVYPPPRVAHRIQEQACPAVSSVMFPLQDVSGGGGGDITVPACSTCILQLPSHITKLQPGCRPLHPWTNLWSLQSFLQTSLHRSLWETHRSSGAGGSSDHRGHV